MPRTTAFRPACLSCDCLEERIALSGAAGAVAPSVLLRTFHTPLRTVRPAKPSVTSLVDLAYNSFRQDYGQVRATYLASVQAGSATTQDRNAFVSYTAQRVDLLAQEVTNSLLVYPKGGARGGRGGSALPLIINRINGLGGVTTKQGGSLRSDLTSTIPAFDASTTTVAIATIAQDEAIEASHVSTLNGVTIVRNGYFSSSKNK